MAFKMKGSPFAKSTPTAKTYTRHRGTGEIREEIEGGFSIIKEGTSKVNRTKENKKDWVPSTKEGKNL